MPYSVMVKVKPEDAEACDKALHELCVSVYNDSSESMKKLPEILSKRLPTVLSMSYEKSKDDDAVFFVYFPIDIPFINVMMFQAKRRFKQIIRNFLESKGIKAEVK